MTLRIPDRDAFLDATLTLLWEHDLPPQRVDREDGLVVTRPTTGQQWFEFWRRDASTRKDVAESALHTIYRRAAVTVTRREVSVGPDKWRAEYKVAVVVEKSRSNRAAPHVTSTSEAYDMFRRPGDIRRLSGPGEGSALEAGKARLGRDRNLEQIILGRIQVLKAKKLGALSK